MFNILLPISQSICKAGKTTSLKNCDVRQNLLHYKLLKTETRYVEQGGHAYKCELCLEQQQNWHSGFELRWDKNVISWKPWAGTRHKQRSTSVAGQKYMERKIGRVYKRREKGERSRRKK